MKTIVKFDDTTTFPVYTIQCGEVVITFNLDIFNAILTVKSSEDFLTKISIEELRGTTELLGNQVDYLTKLNTDENLVEELKVCHYLVFIRQILNLIKQTVSTTTFSYLNATLALGIEGIQLKEDTFKFFNCIEGTDYNSHDFGIALNNLNLVLSNFVVNPRLSGVITENECEKIVISDTIIIEKSSRGLNIYSLAWDGSTHSTTYLINFNFTVYTKKVLNILDYFRNSYIDTGEAVDKHICEICTEIFSWMAVIRTLQYNPLVLPDPTILSEAVSKIYLS